jgi:hypothetical protein
MNVFCDFHHAGLYKSLQLLFEKHFGWSLYRPIGEDWFTRGYWRLAEPYGNNAGTIRQFLSTETANWEAFVNLNGSYTVEDGIYHIYDPIEKCHQKAITYQKFMSMPIDFVISTYEPHDFTFQNLANEHHPRCKFVVQMGNIFQKTDAKYVMCSTAPYSVPVNKEVIFYHQEFPLDIFKFTPPPQNKRITSMVMLLPEASKYYAQKAEMPDYEFRAYGVGAPEGVINSLEDIAKQMQESMFGWHVKPFGDGFGHIIHNWAASGRPIITNFADYRDKLAGQFLINGVTALDIENLPPAMIASEIRRMSEPETHQKMCEAIHAKFTEVCNFDREAEALKQFFADIV